MATAFKSISGSSAPPAEGRIRSGQLDQELWRLIISVAGRAGKNFFEDRLSPHDIPARDIVLAGRNFTDEDLMTAHPADKKTTGAYVPYGTRTEPGQKIPGRLPATGAIMRVPLGGGALELVAWGLRNPFGLAFAPDGKLYATENGFDMRGSRPIAEGPDVLWRIESGAWYGWPDFAAGIPGTDPRFKPKDGPQPEFLLAKHPQALRTRRPRPSTGIPGRPRESSSPFRVLHPRGGFRPG